MNALAAITLPEPSPLSASKSILTGRDYNRIAKAIDAMVAASADGEAFPSLADLAARADLSPFHFQRLFKRWAGVSPKQFASYLTVTHAKDALERAASVLNTSFDVGLSGASRLHDQFVAVEAMTPGEYKARGRDLVIRHGVHETPFGKALLLVTERGVCGLEFLRGSEAAALKAARARWPLSKFTADQQGTAKIAAAMFSGKPQRLLLRGTNFQLQVWQALLRLQPGDIASYAGIAEAIGKPKAVRAVGTALGANTLGYLVPCHRVLRSTGLFKDYRWGATRRYAMLGWEAAHEAQRAAG